MHFVDPRALACLHVIGSGDVKLGAVEGVYAEINGISYGAARPSAGKPVSRGRATSVGTRGAGRTMLPRCAAPAVRQAS